MTIKVDKGGKKTYGIDVLWHYLYTVTMPGASKSKFENSFKLAKFLLTLINRNAWEKSFFSCVQKNLVPSRMSLQMHEILSSILAIHLKKPDKQVCYWHNPSQGAIEKAKKVASKYNKQHHSSWVIFTQWTFWYCNDVGVTSSSISLWHCQYVVNETYGNVNLRCQPDIRILRLHFNIVMILLW